MKWSPSVRAILSLAFLLTLLIANALVSYSTTSQLRQSTALVIQTHTLMDTLSRVRSNLVNAESRQRGYLITGLPALMEPYRNAKLDVNSEMKHLAALIRDNLTQQAHLAALTPLITKRLAFLDRTIQARDTDGFARAQGLIAGGEGLSLMEAIHDRLTKMYAIEQESLSTRADVAKRSYLIAVLSEGLAALAAIALAAATAYFYWRDVRSRERARAELNEQKEWFRTTLASIGDAVIVTDADGHISFMNDVAQTLTAWNLNDAAGRRLADIFQIVSETTRRRADDPVAKVIESGAVAGLANHTVLIARDKKEYPIEDSAAPIRGTDGKILGVVLVFRDIRERNVAEAALTASERQLRMITDIAPVYLARVDTQLRYLFVNKAYAERFGLDRDAVIGKRIPEVVGEQAFATFEPYVERAFAGEAVEFEIDIPYRQIGMHHMHVSYMPERNAHDEVCGLVAVITDITSRKRAEEQLKQADRRKDEFLAMLSHELRSPLAPIRTAVEIMGRSGPFEPNVEKARAIIQRQVEHLTRLVDDLLDVSRITHSKITVRIATVELAPVVMHALDTARPLIDARTQTLLVNLPPGPLYVKADSVRLAQIFANVLANAAKYTQEGGRIELSVEGDQDTVKIRVRDNGIGISAELLPQVFDLFTQAERSADRAQGGLGIGLTLARRLLELQGGTIRAFSAGLGTGSEFVIELPAGVAAECIASEQTAGKSAVSRRRRKILVVDDNVDSAESLTFLLKSNGDELRIAHDGPSALTAARSFLPDIILLDIGLPSLSGYEVAGQLRTYPETQHAVLIALTGYGQPEDRRKAMEAGFDHHLVKPVDLEKLEKLIDSVEPQAVPSPSVLRAGLSS